MVVFYCLSFGKLRWDIKLHTHNVVLQCAAIDINLNQPETFVSTRGGHAEPSSSLHTTRYYFLSTCTQIRLWVSHKKVVSFFFKEDFFGNVPWISTLHSSLPRSRKRLLLLITLCTWQCVNYLPSKRSSHFKVKLSHMFSLDHCVS